MEDKRGKYKLIVIAAVCIMAAVTGICVHWGKNAVRGKHHIIEQVETPEDLQEDMAEDLPESMSEDLPGEWTEDEIAAVENTLRKRYGDGLRRVSVSAEYPEGAEDGKVTVVTFRAPSIRTAGDDFYFQVKSAPEFFDNFSFQLMKSDALRYWDNKGRAFGLYSASDGTMYGEDDERWDTKSYPGELDQLCVYCHRENDVASCAADIADWLVYASEDDRYFLKNDMTDGKETDPFRNIWIRTQKSWYLLNIEEVVENIKESSWEELERSIARAIVNLDNQYQIWEREAPGDVTENDTGTENGDSFGPEEEEKEARQWPRDDFEKECEIEDGRIRYRMVVMDAAAGSRWYGLVKSVDRGLSWQVVSDSPFCGDMGMGVDFTFLNEELGFATLMHNGGDEAYLYITEDGGESYQIVVIQGLDVTLEDGYLYNPYDYPQMPYEEDGKLYVLCGQGADGDYDGGDAAGMALFESTDGGHTFVYKGIQKGEKE